MNTLAATLSQLPEVNWTNALFAYGPLGVMCCFLMYLSNKKLDGISTEVVTELRVLGHRFNGLSRALFAEVLTRESVPDSVRKIVQKEMDRIEDEDDVKDLRARKR